ncbi:MAG: DUF2065 family protein [Hyphomicrobiaceae bacterium]
MSDFLVAIGLVLVLEGLLWAVFPWLATRLLETAATTPEHSLRAAGAGAVAAGVLIVWLVRG